MQSLLADVDTPAITAFLDAVDRVMNSNTVLLKVHADMVLMREPCAQMLAAFLHAPLFMDMMLHLDQQHGWYNWHELVRSETDDVELRPRHGQLVKPKMWPKLKPMSVLGFVERLHWMLRTAFSPYQQHVTEEVAHALIAALLYDLFGSKGWTITNGPSPWIGMPSWVEHPWHFYDVRPDFLESTDYYIHPEELPELAYFDGGESDSCTLFHDDTTFYLLLTNGSP